MSREILFRAKHVHALSGNKHLDGVWVEGYLCDENYINTGESERLIDSDTICQYTGLMDKSGKKVFENDIIKHHFGKRYASVKYGTYQNRFDSSLSEHIGFYVDWPDDEYTRKDLEYWINMAKVEIVGNIFDNPELMEEKTCH